MSLKKITLFKLLMVFCATLFLSFEMDAQTRTKSSNPGTTVSVDNATVSVNSPITFTGGSNVGTSNFNAGCQITDVNVTIRWAKTDGSCTSPLTGDSHHDETGFILRSPDGTEVSLFDPGTYTGTATMSLITQTFDQSAGSLPGGATPAGGTYRAEGNLNNFNGGSGIGTWTLRAIDNGVADPLCIDYWIITVTTATDNTGPTALCNSVTKTLSSGGTASITAAEINNNSSDLCGVSNVSVSPSTFNCSNIGSNNVTLTVTDIYGNTSSCTGTVTIQDNQAPTISCPGTVTTATDAGSCSTNASNVSLGTPTTSDNCGVTVTNNAPASYPLGNTTVTWTVTDDGGNTTQCTQTVTITDGENPTINCPGPIALNTSAGFCTAVGGSIGTATANDNCGNPTVTNDAPTTFPLGVTTVTWTATDAAGNSVSCTQTVIVQDNEDPQINCSGPPIVLNTDAGVCTASSSALSNPIVSDNCSALGNASSPITIVNNAPANLPLGQTIVTYTATDNAGNSASCTRTITVEDNELPTISCPATINATANFNGCTAAFVSLGSPTTGDNCGVASTTNDAPGAFPLGTTMVTWTVTDDSGNTSQCIQNVIVVSDISVSASITAETCPGNGEIDLTVTSGSFVTSVSWSNGESTEDITGLAAGDYTVTISNANGCTASATYTVGSIPDTEAPVITACATDINANADAPGCMQATGINLGTPPTSTDNCGVVSTTNDATGTFFVGPNLVTWTVTDAAGNTAQCFQVVTITGNTTFINGTPTDEICAAANGSIDLDIAGDPAITIVWSNGETTEDISGLAAGDYSVTATNANGCETVGTYTVGSVADSENPIITACPAAITVVADTPGCTVATGVTLGNPTATDNCAVTSMTNDAPASFPVGLTVVTWTVSDAAGNTAQCSQDVNVSGDCSVALTLRMFLEGPYAGGQMNDQLRSGGLIPLQEPYTAMTAFTHTGGGGGEMTTAPVFAVTGTDAIVDWVFIELRDATDATIVLATRSALVQKDGDVVDVDGVSPVTFSSSFTDDYYIAIRHRNHLGAMTLNTVAASTSTSMVDFTDPSTMIYGTNALRDVGGVMCMFSGNVDGNAVIRASGPAFINDASQILGRLGTYTTFVGGVYETYDVNMDSNIRLSGPAFINDGSKLLNTLGAYNNVVLEQLP